MILQAAEPDLDLNLATDFLVGETCKSLYNIHEYFGYRRCKFD